MNADFKQIVNKYMLDHKVQFEGCIDQSELYDVNGAVNINYIIDQAKSDICRLKNILDEESIIFFKSQVLNAVKKNDNKTVLYLLFFYFIVCLNSMPIFTAMLAINENTFNTYCQVLPYLI